MKKSKSLLVLLTIIFSSLFVSKTHAQYSYSLYVTNEFQPDSKTYQFDVYLLSTGTTQIEFSMIQFGLGFDTSIVNGGTLSYYFVPGSSEVVNSPTGFSIGAASQTNTVNGITYRYFNQAPKTGPGPGNGSIISSIKNSCFSPGTRIGTYQIKNTVAFKVRSSCKHIFYSGVAASGKTVTSVWGYVGASSVLINSYNRYRYDTAGTCLTNILLNNCTSDTIAEVPQNVCDSITWHGTTYYTSGIKYWKAGYNKFGCDSIKSINLTINQSTTSSTTISNCGSHTWNGTTYTTSGTKIWTGTNAVGCDSLAKLVLTIKQPTSSSTTVSNCTSYAWNGKTYTASGRYDTTFVGGNAAGCDSTATLVLTIKQKTSSSTPVSNCTSYTWNGKTYTASGRYDTTFVGGNAAGCDSTATLVLTIKQPTSSSDTVSNCLSYTWNGITYTTSGVKTWTGTNAVGCDSVATLNLTIKQPTSSTTTISSCISYTWNGITYTTRGAKIWTGTNAAGCDSTATLNLTIKQPTTSSTTVSSCVSYTWNGTTYTTSGIKTWTGANAVGCDSVATLNLTIKQPTTSYTTVSNCVSYTWNGTTYTTSGIKTWTGTNAAGCDSVATLNLTIKQPTTSSTTVSNCTSYTWNGTTYTTSGTKTKILTNASGCDSTATLVLTIKQKTSSSTPISNCTSYTWNGKTYTTSGTYDTTFVGRNAAGCDSTATLVLTIKQKTSSSTTVSNCVSYTWNGTTYTTSGVKTWTGTNAAGCDSTATLNLTIKQPTTSSTTVSSCVSYTWNGVTYTTSGTKTKTFTNAVGCDSTATLNLTIKQPTTSSTTVSSCVSYTWNGTTYITSGTKTKTFTNAVGCDSVATLNLTIKQPTTSTTTISNCVSYTWNGKTYTSSGTYDTTFVGGNAAGCDSTARLVLSIKQKTSSSTPVSNCTSYTWNGKTYTASGTYDTTFVGGNAAGCDSTARLVLTIKQKTSSSATVSNCVSYTWNGKTYTASGIYDTTFAGGNATGCDSTARLVLTIINNTSSTEFRSECVSYNWNGVTYTTSGSKTKIFVNAAGCDSIATLNLTIKQPTTSSTTNSSCNSYTWNGVTYTTSGTKIKTFTNAVGCDSTATLNLTIKQHTTSTTTVSSCGSYTWNGAMYTTSGTKSKTFANAEGCDSTAILNLTIKQPTTSTTTISSCGSYTWNGTTYTTSGTKTWSGFNTAGCDSVAVLNLTISNMPIAGPLSGNQSVNINGTSSIVSSGTSGGLWSSSNSLVATVNTTSGLVTGLTAGSVYIVYTVTGTNGCGVVKDSLLLNVVGNVQNGYSLYVTNELQLDAKTYQFDVYLLNTRASRIELAMIQFGLGFDTSIANGGTLSYSFIPGSSQIVNAPTNFSIGSTNQTNTVNGITYRYFNQAAKTSPGAGNGTIISSVKNNCVSPGTRIGTYQIKNTTAFKPYSSCKHIFYSGAAASGKTITTVWEYVGQTITAMNSYNRYRYDTAGTCLANILLNTCVSDTIAESSQTVCDSIVWHGVKYTTSGTKYWKAGNNLSGCDSFKSINLIVNKASSSTTSVVACSSYTWNGVTYTTSGTYNKRVTNNAGCDSIAILNLTINTCLNVKLFLQGSYIGNRTMTATLNSRDLGPISTDPTATDSITISLWKPDSLNKQRADYSFKTILHSNGNANIPLTSSLMGNDYYIVINHRNSIETWSANPVQINSTVNYDFTTSESKAYEDGVNPSMKYMESGVYAIYGGDVNQDGTIDILDMQRAENDSYGFLFGYNSSDCNGDGSSDGFDMQLLEQNASLFIYYARPY